MWKDTNQKQIYPTDGDNYLDLCLQLSEADGDGKDIQAVSIQEGAVFPPRGTGPNIAHTVRVDHIAANGPYPHNLEMTPFADKMFDRYVEVVFGYLSIAGTTGLGIILIPLLGLGIGTGLMFL